MSESSKIRSLNVGIADELKLEELEGRLELSPIGVLEMLLAEADIGTAPIRENCPTDCNCHGAYEREPSCRAYDDSPPKENCSINNACGDYGCSALA